MGKLILPLIIGLLMGVGGGGFFAVYKASAAHATAVAVAQKKGLTPAGDSAHAAKDSTRVDSATHGDVPHDAATPVDAHDPAPKAVAAATPVAAPAHAPETRASPVAPTAAIATPPKGTSVPSAAPVTPVTPVTPVSAGGSPTADETENHQRRLGKIFATMGAKDAARVLAQMNDHDVSIIINKLSERQAAAILTNLPAPRAAALSQMQPRKSGGGK